MSTRQDDLSECSLSDLKQRLHSLEVEVHRTMERHMDMRFSLYHAATKSVRRQIELLEMQIRAVKEEIARRSEQTVEERQERSD